MRHCSEHDDQRTGSDDRLPNEAGDFAPVTRSVTMGGAVPEPGEAASVLPGMGALRRVLVVEDDDFISADIACTLDESGFNVAGTAQSLGAAMRFVRDNAGQFDCALLDVDLGGESCQPLAASLDGLNVPYLLVTAHSEDVVRELGFRAPVIEKPFQAVQLSNRLSGLFVREPQEA